MRIISKSSAFVLFVFFYLFIICCSQSSETHVQARLVFENNRWRDYSECGVHPNQFGSTPVLKIIGGRQSSVSIWPWVVQIYSSNGPICAGTLLNRRYVLTVASCVNRNIRYGVIVGKGLRSRLNFQEKRIGVRRVFIPPGFKDGLYENDVAMLLLRRPVNFTEFVRPVCIPEYGLDIDNATSNDSFVGRSCTVLGWGLTRAYDIRSLSRNLRQVSVPIYSGEQCANVTSGFFTPGRTLFCAGGIGGQGTCEGDGGGPLLCLHSDQKYYIHGMLSSGLGCGVEDLPDFYTDVGHRRINGWIRGLLS